MYEIAFETMSGPASTHTQIMQYTKLSLNYLYDTEHTTRAVSSF